MSIDLWGVTLSAVITAVVGVLVMESYQATPWLADKLMQWSVRLRYADNPERGTVRGEELTSLLGDLPTLFKLPTAGGFLLRALAYRLAHRRGHAKREPPATQRSLGARFRVALVKAGLVVVCAGTVFGIELVLANRVASASIGEDSIVPLGVAAGILAAIESVARPSKFHYGLIGGIALTLLIVGYGVMFSVSFGEVVPAALFGGMAFGAATAFTCALTGKSRYAGVVVGTGANLTGFTLIVLADSSEGAAYVILFSGIGLAAGVLAGFTAVAERAHREKYARDGSPVATRESRMQMIDTAPIPPVSADSLLGPGAVNPEPSIPVGESPRQE